MWTCPPVINPFRGRKKPGLGVRSRSQGRVLAYAAVRAWGWGLSPRRRLRDWSCFLHRSPCFLQEGVCI